MKKKSKPKRVQRSKVRAIIPLDTQKIRKNELNKFKRNKTVYAQLTDQVEQFEKNDVPAFSQWLKTGCAASLQKINTLHEKAFALQNTLDLAEELHYFYHYAQNECAEAAIHYIETNGDIPEGFESFFEEHASHDKRQEDPFGSFDNEPEDFDGEEAEAARKFFESLLDDFADGFCADDLDFSDPFGPRKKTPKELKTIKKLYRKITHKLHPDRVGNATPDQQDLWHAAQQAYKANDLETLQHIDASCDLFSDKLLRFASISSIRNGINLYKQKNTQIRRILRQMKKNPEWGFLSWSDKKKKRVLKKYTDELNDDLILLSLQHSSMQHQLDQMLNVPKTRRKKSASKPPTPQSPDQGQFDFF